MCEVSDEAPVVRRAASLLLDMSRWDVISFLRTLEEVRDETECKDIIIAMALLVRSEINPAPLQEIMVIEALRETM